jgi:hypothetical protein
MPDEKIVSLADEKIVSLAPRPPRRRGPGVPFKPGNPGKPVGCKNKIPAQMAEIVRGCFENLGGLAWMQGQVEQDKDFRLAYLHLVAKLMPSKFEGETKITLMFPDGASAGDCARAAELAFRAEHGENDDGGEK